MNKQELRESAEAMVREVSTVLVEAIRTGAEQTRIELAQVRAEMRDDALTGALERLGERRQVIADKLSRASSGAVKRALGKQLAQVEEQEGELLARMGVETETDTPHLYERQGRRFVAIHPPASGDPNGAGR